MSGEFWLTDEPRDRLRPLLPNRPRGLPRSSRDPRRRPCAAGRLPLEGCVERPWPVKNAAQSAKRRSKKGPCHAVFEALAAVGGLAEVLIDSTYVKAHRSAAGGKGGARAGDRHQSSPTQHQDSRHRRRQRQAARLPADAGSRCRLSSSEPLLGGLPARCIVQADLPYDAKCIRNIVIYSLQIAV